MPPNNHVVPIAMSVDHDLNRTTPLAKLTQQISTYLDRNRSGPQYLQAIRTRRVFFTAQKYPRCATHGIAGTRLLGVRDDHASAALNSSSSLCRVKNSVPLHVHSESQEPPIRTATARRSPRISRSASLNLATLPGVP